MSKSKKKKITNDELLHHWERWLIHVEGYLHNHFQPALTLQEKVTIATELEKTLLKYVETDGQEGDISSSFDLALTQMKKLRKL